MTQRGEVAVAIERCFDPVLIWDADMPFILLAFLAVAAEPRDTTIAAILADPDAYAGQSVRLTGQIDQCAIWQCAACPQEATTTTVDPAQCLRISFGPNELSSASDAAYRYSDVTLVARFDPSCMPRPAKPRGDVVLCTDRASVLQDARVTRVLKRRKSTVGLFNGKTDLLSSADATTTEAVAAAYRQVMGDRAERLAQRVFTWASGADGALFCQARMVDRNDISWPTHWEAATLARSRTDDFNCYSMRRIDGRWYYAHSG